MLLRSLVARSVIARQTRQSHVLSTSPNWIRGNGDVYVRYLVPERYLSTPAPQDVHSDLPTERYHALSDTTMDVLLESLEGIIDNVGDPSYEVEYSSGVLTLRLGNHGIYVINKQPPNKQIWLSSPFSGPKRYDYHPESDDWVYARDHSSLRSLLEEELENILGQKVDLGLQGISGKVE